MQIRTFEMHQHSELGVAAHWRYKEGGKSDAKFDEKIAWIALKYWPGKMKLADTGDLLEQFNSALFQDKVYVLTIQGKVIDLPMGATPVDFAYALHTDLGHRTRGAKVNGSIVPLNATKLQNGQRIEILTSKAWLAQPRLAECPRLAISKVRAHAPKLGIGLSINILKKMWRKAAPSLIANCIVLGWARSIREKLHRSCNLIS